jgi:hypothetical protein
MHTNLNGRNDLEKPRFKWDDHIKIYLKEIRLRTGLVGLGSKPCGLF